MRKAVLCMILIFLFGCVGFVETGIPEENETAGTFFGEPISKGNYDFVLRVVLSFDSPWGGIPNNREQLERRVWDDLLLSYEAYRRQISVKREDLEAKIGEALKGDQVSFNWKEDPGLYAQWVKETLGGPVEIFENQMRHLVQIEKLRAQVLDSIDRAVTEEEAFQEFLNEYNNLSVELAEFDELNKAQEFYQKVIEYPLFWEREAKKDKKEDNEHRSFRRPGFVALEFLIEMWKFPKDTVYEMIEMEIGDVHSPAPIYEGYGVFKVLDIRRADEQTFPKRRASYFDQLRTRKKYQGFNKWLEDLRDDADIQVYIDLPPEISL